ncbi:sugar transferase [Sphingomonas japonica]
MRARMYVILAAIDIACIFASFVVASVVYGMPLASGQWAVVASSLAPIYVAAAANGGAYSAEVLVTPGQGVTRSLRALLLAIGVLMFLAFYLKVGATFSRGTFAIGSVIGFAALAFARRAYLRHARIVLSGTAYNVMLISDQDDIHAADDHTTIIRGDSWLDPEQHCPEMYNRLAQMLATSDRVVIDCAPERRVAWVRLLKGANVRSEVIAPELSRLAPLGIDNWSNQPTIVVAEGPLSQVDAAMKRAFDIVVSGLALIVLAPLLAVIALLIRRDSPGPILFVQTRIGQGNRLFRMLKFRSMRTDRSDGHGNRSASRDDERVTALGRFIRKTSIDELPQLINVLKGDMSIVGPRPHAVGSRAADKLFWEVDDRYWHRHAIKPGLTGLAQVRGFRGATAIERDLTDRLQADLEYLRDWSLMKDVMIILQTFRVLTHKNAF